MADLIFILITVVFFSVSAAYVRGCDRLYNRGRYGVGLYGWVDRLFFYHGLFDLRATLAGKVLVSDSERTNSKLIA